MFGWDAMAPSETGKRFKSKMFIGLSWKCTEMKKIGNGRRRWLDFKEQMNPSKGGQRIAVGHFRQDK